MSFRIFSWWVWLGIIGATTIAYLILVFYASSLSGLAFTCVMYLFYAGLFIWTLSSRKKVNGLSEQSCDHSIQFPVGRACGDRIEIDRIEVMATEEFLVLYQETRKWRCAQCGQIELRKTKQFVNERKFKS